MKCPFCGSELGDGVRFCTSCMNSLIEKTEIKPYRPQKRRRKIWIVLLVGVLLLILTALALPYAAAGGAVITGGIL